MKEIWLFGDEQDRQFGSHFDPLCCSLGFRKWQEQGMAGIRGFIQGFLYIPRGREVEDFHIPVLDSVSEFVKGELQTLCHGMCISCNSYFE